MPEIHNEVSGTVHGAIIQAQTVAVTTSNSHRRPVWMVPEPGRAPVDRPGVADRLAALVRSGAPVVGVVGAGGFGKTTLAAQVCHRVRDRFPGGVLWLTLGEHVPDPLLADKVNDLTEVLTGRRPALTDPLTAGHRLGEVLAEAPPTLLVVDDLWAASRLAPFLRARACLVTTRTPGALPSDAEVVIVTAMSAVESRTLLTRGLPDMAATDRLLRLTGRWPLLLALVNSTIRRSVADGSTAAAAADSVAEQLLEDGPDCLDLDSADRRDQAVRATVEASTDRLGDADRDRFRELVVFPADTDLPGAVLHVLWRGTAGSDESRTRALCRRLVDLSLLSRVGDAFRLHDVLLAYLRNAVGARRLTELNGHLVDGLVPADWAEAAPYARRHLAAHAAAAHRVDELLTDPGYLLAAGQPGLLPHLDAATGADAVRAAAVYRRAAHHLRDHDVEQRPAYLEFAARRAGADDLAARTARHATGSAWRCSWTAWEPSVEHKVLIRHQRPVEDVVVAPLRGGVTWVISRDDSGVVRVVDLDTNETVQPPWLDRDERVGAIACVPRLGAGPLVLLDAGSGLRVRDCATGDPVPWDVDEPDAGVAQIVSTRARAAIVTYTDGTARTWDADTGARIGPTAALRLDAGADWRVAAATLNDDVPAVAVMGSRHSVIRVMDLAAGTPVRQGFDAVMAAPEALVCTRRTVLALSRNQVLRWSLSPGEVIGARANPTGRRPTALITGDLADGREVVLSGDEAGQICVWDADTGAPLAEPLAAHGDEVGALSCARLADGRVVVASGSADNTVRLWDTRDVLAPSTRAVAGPVGVTGVVAAAGWRVSGHADGRVRFWSGAETEVAGPAPVVEVTRAGEFAVSLHEDGSLLVFDGDGRVGAPAARPWAGRATSVTGTLLDGRPVVVITGTANLLEARALPDWEPLWRLRPPGRLRVAPVDGAELLAATTSAGYLQVRDLATGRVVGDQIAIQCHNPTTALATLVHPDGGVLAVSGNARGQVVAWRLGDHNAPVWMSGDAGDPVRAVVCAVLPGGTPVAVTAGTALRAWRLDEPVAAPWTPTCEIDLDAPITALAAPTPGELLVGTRHGLARLHLRDPAGEPAV
ncbi:WD40 repeat domain-containing protein [Actinokineospora auranticolor]|uniref:WD40 repeat protein n=1 Tax=Actinokineospora auranticolor TaxID=155976 RepID=A0A2S6GHI5_9PSEU|nr:WD40 repeat domain-containing protein [Actinokineospora auranticolor]PPK64663.1 WD40 repeat protein [Actinokineospora auranticolor]